MARIVGHKLAVSGQDLTAVDGPSTDTGANGLGQRNDLGGRVFDDLGNEYVYLSGVASLAVGDVVIYGQGSTAAAFFTAVRMLNDANSGGAGLVAVAMGNPVAATSFGWFQIFGLSANINVATVAAPTGAAALYRTSTTSRVSTTAVAKDGIFGLFLNGASVANKGPVSLSYPFVMDQSTL